MELAVEQQREHADPVTATGPAQGPVSITLLRSPTGGPDLEASPQQHWHVTERGGRIRLRRRGRVLRELGVRNPRDAFAALTSRTSELLLDGWDLSVQDSSDRLVVLHRAHQHLSIEVLECWDAACVAALQSAPLAASVSA